MEGKTMTSEVGRPTKYCPEIVQAIVDLIRNDGMSPTGAGRLAGISHQTVSEWRKEISEFGEAVARAEDEFKLGRLQNIKSGITATGKHDWKADAWLLERRFRDEFGASDKAQVNVAVGVQVTISEESRQQLAERRRAALEG